MKKTLTCKICGHEIAEEYLHKHQESENKEIIDYTITMIKDSNPNWMETDGTCQKCWDYYKSL